MIDGSTALIRVDYTVNVVLKYPRVCLDGNRDRAKIYGRLELLRIVRRDISNACDFDFALSCIVSALVVHCTVRVVLLGLQHLFLGVAERVVHEPAVAPVVCLRTID